ncbi:Ig-like domain-containing protein [Marinoscillum sp.]|uniref:Ig-like domain-containing protein n=1 Tax=Marinoscillum sp. TaxID=2024838 RepID=UPI003BA9952C
MTWKNQIFQILIASILLASCDAFQEDVAPKGEEELVLVEGISALPNTPVFIDLKKTIRSSETVRFSIGAAPIKGSATISDQAILQYIPNSDFTQGQDVVSIQLINRSGQPIDTDSLLITMATSADSLPCFNGALSDYYSVSKNSSLIIYPIANDGYCVESTSGAVIDFLAEPAHGTLSQVELFTYRYTPDVDFVGQEQFMYELTLIDNEGAEFYSLGQVNIEVTIASSGCDSMVYPLTYEMPDSLSYLDVLPYAPSPACDVFTWTVHLKSVLSGSAEVLHNGLIRYYPGTDSIDVIDYSISFGDQTFDNQITIIIEGRTDDQCLEAIYDEYQLPIKKDSLGTRDHPYILDVAENDITCSSEYAIAILIEPEIGVSSVNAEHMIEYYVEDFESDSTETALLYQICAGGACDTAHVSLMLEF